MSLIKRFFTFLFLILLGLPTFLWVEPVYYPQWIGGYGVFLTLALAFSWFVVPSRKRTQLIKATAQELDLIIKLEQTTRGNAIKIQTTCPQCEKKHALWTFMETKVCPECGSDLWTTSVHKTDPEVLPLIEALEQVRIFYAKTPEALLKKARKAYLQF